MTSRNRERSVHDRTHTHLRAIQEGQTHQGASMGELLNDIKTNTSNINLNVDSLEVNTDTLEAKIQETNTKLDTFSGAGNNNVGEGQVKLQIFNYGRDASAGNYKPMAVDGDGHLQVDCLATALPTGASTEAKQDVTNTKLDTLQATFDADITRFTNNQIKNHLTQNGDGTGNKAGVILDALNTNTITQNTNFFNKAAFLQASVDAESSPPSATTEILLTQDVPMQFKMTNLNNSVDDVATAVSTNTGTLNATLTTIDTDTGNLVNLVTAGNTIHNANNSLQSGILNGLSGDNSGGGTFAGQNLQNIADRLFDDNKSVANGVNAINTNAISRNSKLDTISSNTAEISDVKTSIDTMRQDHTLTDLHTLLNAGLPSTLESDKLKVDDADTHTKLDTLETTLTNIETDIAANEVLLTSVNNRLFDDNKSVANAVNSVNTNTITNTGKLDDINFNLAANNLVLGGGLPSALSSDQLKVSDSSAHTKLDTLETTLTAIETDVAANEVLLTSVNNRLFDDNKSVATGVNALNTNLISALSKLDDVINLLNNIDSKTGASGHFGNP